MVVSEKNKKGYFNRHKKKGQSSVEYLSVVGIALMVLIPGSYLFLNYSKSTTDELASSQLNMLGNTIMDEAEKMYVLGDNSWITLDMSFPGTLKEARIQGSKDLFFTFTTTKGDSQVVFFAERFNITNGTTSNACDTSCNLTIRPGSNRIKIQSRGTFVSIEPVY